MLAAVSAILLAKGAYEWLLATGLPTLTLLVVTFLRLRGCISEMNASLSTELGDNPFAGLAQAFAQSVPLEFGWAVLILGSGLLLVAALKGRSPTARAVGTAEVWSFSRAAVLTAVAASTAMLLLGLTDLLRRHWRRFRVKCADHVVCGTGNAGRLLAGAGIGSCGSLQIRPPLRVAQ